MNKYAMIALLGSLLIFNFTPSALAEDSFGACHKLSLQEIESMPGLSALKEHVTKELGGDWKAVRISFKED